jgi:hypothetical protein
MGIEDILKAVPLDDIAKQFGVSKDVATQAVAQGGAVLLNGLANNAKSDTGSAAIEKALANHKGSKKAKTVDEIDAADGAKIVKHVLGKNTTKVTKAMNKAEETAGGIDFAKLLPILAPIVMGLIAKNMGSKSTTESAAESGGNILGDVIGGMLGGGDGGGGIDLGSVVGGLLGGGDSKSKKSSGGGIDIGGILGGLLGGKK